MSKTGRNKEVRMEGKLKTYDKKGYGSRVLVEIWDSRACTYEGNGESKELNVLQESILRWWRRKLMR